MTEYPAFINPTTRKWCARSGRYHVQRQVLAGTDLCGPCHALFKRVLQDLVDSWPLLLESEIRRPARVYSDEPRAPSVTPKDASSRWNPAATLTIADITDWYGFLARTIMKERPAPASSTPRVIVGPLTKAATDHAERMTVRTVSAWAITGNEEIRLGLAAIRHWHARWLSHHPAIGAHVLDEALKYQWAVNKALETLPVRRFHLAGFLCKHVMEETPLGIRYCEGQLVGVLRHEADEKPSAIMCSTHPDHAIPPEQWIFLDTQP